MSTEPKKKTAKAENLGKAELLDYLRSMSEIRAFEEKLRELLMGGKIKSASHMYAGEEAVAVGSVSTLLPQDIIASTHRGHGHCGAIGDKHAHTEEERQEHWNKMVAELMGKVTGYCRGRGGSLHIADVEKGNLGSTGIVGGNIPVATGAAMAEKLKGTDAVVLCYFGDGATNTGSFHESLNMGSAMLGGLPIVYICENNLYGMSVPFYKHTVPEAGQASNIENIADRASSYGMPSKIVDGMDVLAVREAVQWGVDRARKGEGPSFIECKTYRWYGHSNSDQRAYRTREEEAEWKARCPIETLKKKLVDQGIATQEEVDAAHKKGYETIEKATQFGFDSPYPSVDEIDEFVYIERDEKEWQAERKQDETLRAKVRSVEDAIRTRTREVNGKTDKAILPKIGKDDAAKFQEQSGMKIINFGQALVEAQDEEMARDERVIHFGEDVGLYGGAYAASKGLYTKYGPNRVMDTAISEAAIAGAACGAALRGMRPIPEIMYGDFLTISSDQIVHNIAYNRYIFGGKTKMPIVIRTEGGVGRCMAAHHSESLEAWFMNIPGLYLVMPATPYDAKGLMKASIRDDNPVLFIEHKLMYSGVMGPVPEEEYVIPLGVADVKREGTDVTIVAYSRMVHFALEAALRLAEEGISAEVVDPRTLNPLDTETLANSVKKTGKLIAISEGYQRCGIAGEIVRQICEYKFANGWTGFDYLDAQPIMLASRDVPIPMSAALEPLSVPTVDDITSSAKKLCRK